MEEPNAPVLFRSWSSPMGELVEHRVAILLISSEMAELLGRSNRVAVMQEGRLQDILSRAEATQERIMELALQYTG